MLAVMLCGCNGGSKIGDPVKEHHFDRRDTVASLYPGEEDQYEAADTTDVDSTQVDELADGLVQAKDQSTVQTKDQPAAARTTTDE